MQEKEEEVGYLILGGQTLSLRRRVVVLKTQTRLRPGFERVKRQRKASPRLGEQEEIKSLFNGKQLKVTTNPSPPAQLVSGT